MTSYMENITLVTSSNITVAYSSEPVNFTCTRNSPIPCRFVDSTTIPVFENIYSFGQDNNKDILLLTKTGVYRIVRSNQCGYKCKADPNSSSMVPQLTPQEAQALNYQQPAPTPEAPPSSTSVATVTPLGL
jgi:hypothetical protein